MIQLIDLRNENLAILLKDNNDLGQTKQPLIIKVLV